MGNLEGLLQQLAPRVKTDDAFAQHLYAALCNVDWQPIGGEHKPECMLVTGELTEHAKNNITVYGADGKKKLPDPWCNCGLSNSFSWRYAGGLVADLRNKGEDYLHFYCSGGEGHVAPEVREAIKELGWEPVPGSEGDPELISVAIEP